MQSVGPYDLQGMIGKGGMGVVYRAVDRRDGREVALKALLSHKGANEASRERTRRELSALARLDHPHVMRLLDSGETTVPYMALELVEGESLDERLRRGPLPLDEALRLAHEQADALSHVHEQGLLHRDIKPDNVLLRPDGSSCLTDFGLTLDLEASYTRLTQTGGLMGTPGYWSPEQARGKARETTPATDVFGFGALLYAALTTHAPVEAPTFMALFSSGTFEQIEPPRARREDVPLWLSELVMDCLAADPAARPSLAEVRERLARGGSGSDAPGAARWLGLGVAALLGALGLALWIGSRGALEATPTSRPSPTPLARLTPTPSATAPGPKSAEAERQLAEALVQTQAGDHVGAAAGYRAAAEAGLPAGMRELARALLLGKGAARDEPQARRWLLRAAEAGDVEAMQMVGGMFARGMGGEEDDVQAREWLQRAAEGGNVAAMAGLAGLLERGEGGPALPEQADRYYQRAAAGGDAQALSRLGYKLLVKGGPDLERAIDYLTRAADAGQVSAMVNLGLAYEEGRGVAQSYERAMGYYQAGLVKGNPTALANAGALLVKGLGTERDERLGLGYLQQAALQGERYAMFELGVLLLEAEQIPKDPVEAARWLERSARKGEPRAMARLGRLYLSAEGVRRDPVLAARWLEAAAKRGSTKGMLAWGRLLLAGEGVTRDPAKAREWLERAAKSRDPQASAEASAELAKLGEGR